jgi:cbb3-type cytochrome oxidase subunit 1
MVVAAALGLLTLASLRFPSLVPAGLSFGRLRAMTMIAAVLGWLVLSVVGGIYYILPRLTATPLSGERLASLGLISAAGVDVIGVALVGMGLGDGGEPFGLPWWYDLFVLITLVIPLVVGVRTLTGRRERNLYPSLWFALGVLIWLPVLYLIGNLPGLTPFGTVIGDLFSGWGILNVVVVGGGTGLAYYSLAKESGNPLASRQLARVGFWSLLFGAIWAGPAQIAFAPLPAWLGGVAAVMGLALPVAVMANATNFALTLGPSLAELRERPSLSAGLVGSVLAMIAGVATAAAAFRSAAALVGFTLYWEGIVILLVFGAGNLLTASWVYQALPKLTGRELASTRLANRHIRLTVAGVGGAALLLMMAGLLTGYGWAGGAYTGAFANAGEGWVQSSSVPGLLTGLAALAFAAGSWGIWTLAADVLRTLSSGRATVQEVLVEETV